MDRASKKMSVKFPDNDDNLNNEFDAAVQGRYKYLFAIVVSETYLLNISTLKCLVYLDSK